MLKMVEKSKQDKLRDKRNGTKEGSKKDVALDKKQLAKMKKNYGKK